jgi:hypothetical protein
MIQILRKSVLWILPTTVGVFLIALFVFASPASAINQLPIPEPIPGSYGLAATKTQEAPTIAPTITTPGNGASFGNSPITVGGICPSDVLVQVYNNGVMVGAVMCVNNSFSLQVSLFAGINEFTAIVFDDLEQAGPTSNTVTVTYNNSNITAFGQLITLTSAYGRRSAPAGTELSWPLQLTGGTGPYAFSIDWGDGSSAELKSVSLSGLVTILHTYKKAGIYQINIKVTDVNGVSAFLQVVAVSSGKLDGTVENAPNTSASTKIEVLWIPAVVAFVMLYPAYWLGRRSQLVSLHNKMLKERDAYADK